MKRFLLSLTSLLLVVSLFGQSNARTGFSKDDYFLKSKKQKKTARILLGGGAALFATGFIIPKGESEGYDVCIYIVCENHKNDDIKAAFGLTGFVSMLASVPFFIASGKNKKRGNSVSGYLKMHKTPLLVKNDKN